MTIANKRIYVGYLNKFVDKYYNICLLSIGKNLVNDDEEEEEDDNELFCGMLD